MMTIEMIGGVYCPLSSTDPQRRLQDLLKQTNSRLILVHSLTRDNLDGCGVIVDLDAMISIEHRVNDADLELLSKVAVTSQHIAYIIFTSGSTGIPKGVS